MATLTVTTSPVELPVGNTDRPVIQNLGPDPCYFDRDPSVSASTGMKLESGRDYELPVSRVKGGGAIYVVSDGTSDLRWMKAG